MDTFFELMPQGSPSDFQRMLDLKVGGEGVGGVLRTPQTVLQLAPAAPLPRPTGRTPPSLATRPPLCPHTSRQVLKRNEYTAILEQFNRRMGRPTLSAAAAAAGGGGGSGAAVGAARSFNLPQMPRLNSGGAAVVGGKASAAAQDVAARLGSMGARITTPNLTAAKASAAAAGESMRDSMSAAMRSMKSKASLRFLQREQGGA